MPIDTTLPDVSATTGIDSDDHSISRIGVELEYPEAARPGAAPATSAHDSTGLYREGPSDWPEGGALSSDHCGAEIQSHIMDLHSDEPERWYVNTIRRAEDRGYPFAGCGRGSSQHGLHMHIDQIDEHLWERLEWMMEEAWTATFFCASVRPDRLDPHRGYGSRTDPETPGFSYFGRSDIRGPDGHYEVRIPGPGTPDHVSMMFHFWRLLEYEGLETAKTWAKERVDEGDPRLTPVQQYQYFYENGDDGEWPHSRGLVGETARGDYLHEVMQEVYY